ncbi:DNA polymerase delta, subunit 4-domain-containing protein [Dichotomopilus funicola]|uniref:DNA polymerase delta, subunit 4-domain-containing protein n=1 Tax=Dichotomopilus funicola TaxID=1934379 RepID=A0AAN6UYA6_9PEZI|nr:DNA polymerase delta, subunit 4-domain-containing protein [Dichotomopilus funicola]
MVTTRRSTRSSSGPGAGKQQTLSFKHKVTKAIQTGKESYKSPSRAREYIPDPSPEPTTEVPATPSKAPKTREGQTPAPEQEEEAEEEEKVKAPVVPEKSEAEAKAAKTSDRAIEKYWEGIESSREARAVHRKHTEGLATGEKVLRYFDVSSQYGPCIGISRLKRWQRAQRLGLNPPVEVLAVLLKEEGNKGIEKAHMDELLNSAAVASVGA